MMKRSFWRVVVLCLVTVIAGCASKRVEKNIFPEPLSMEPMILFWEKVYATWDTHEVVFHDDTYMDVIYDEINLSRFHLSEQEGRRYVQSKKEQISAQLDDLELRLRSHRSLTAQQSNWMKQLKQSGGSRALTDISSRLRTQKGLKSRFKQGLEVSGQYLPYFKAMFKREGLPEALAYLPHVESSFQNHARSFVGAAGMWQFMPGTARSFMPMQRHVVDGRFDPFIAAHGAARYLKESYQRLNSWPLALTSYNHGLGGMIAANNQMGGSIEKIVWYYKGPRFKFASRNFYAEFIAAKRIAENPTHYFPHLRHHAPLPVDGVILHAPMKLSQLALLTGVSQSELIRLNPAWLTHIHNNRAAIPAYMEVWLPKGRAAKLPGHLGKTIWKG